MLSSACHIKGAPAYDRSPLWWHRGPQTPSVNPQRSHCHAHCAWSTATTPPREQSRATQHTTSRRLGYTSTEGPKGIPTCPWATEVSHLSSLPSLIREIQSPLPGQPCHAQIIPSSHNESNTVVSSCQEQRAVMNPSQGIQGLCKTTEAPDSSRPSLAGHQQGKTPWDTKGVSGSRSDFRQRGKQVM